MYIIRVQLYKPVIDIILLLLLADLVTLTVLDPLGTDAKFLLAAAAGASGQSDPGGPVQREGANEQGRH